MKRFAAVLVALMLVAQGCAAALEFRQAPAARQEGDTVRIDFAVSGPTDVEVAILDAQGEVIRHLAAGVLGGENPPPAPLAAGLSQSLVWDGKDDLGEVARGGPFRVRVRAGMEVGFGRTVGDSPYNFRETICRGLAVDGNGDLYEMRQRSRGGVLFFLRVYDREGNYLREILPYPATLDSKSREAIGAVRLPDSGELVPRSYYSLWPVFYPFSKRGRAPSVKLACLDVKGGSLVLLAESFDQMYRIRKRDGGVVTEPFAEKLWDENVRLAGSSACGPVMAAASPDGETLYFAGYAGIPPKGEKLHPAWPDGRIYRMELADRGSGRTQVFADVQLPEDAPPPAQAWDIFRYRTALHGLKVDSQGRVFVCDAAGGKVWVFDKDGNAVSSVDVPHAYMVEVDEKSGALYVLTRYNAQYRVWPRSLVKLSGWKPGSEVVSSLEFPAQGGSADPFLAADFSGEVPQLWLGGCPRTESLLRIRDLGEKLEVIEDLADRGKEASGFAVRLAVDPEADLVYINNGWADNLRYDGITGAYAGPLDEDGNPKSVIGSELAVRRDGMVYAGAPNYSGQFTRLNRDLTPAPFPDGRSKLGFYYGRMGGGYFGNHGSAVTPEGRLLVMNMFNWCQYAVFEVGPDGRGVAHERLKDAAWSHTKEYQEAGIRGALVGWLPSQCGGVKVGPRGYVYIGLRALPRDYEMPDELASVPGYLEMTGSIIKVKPTGGGLYPDDGSTGMWKSGEVEFEIPAEFGEGVALTGIRTQHGERPRQTFFQDAVKAYPRLSVFSGWGRSDYCVCQTPRFEVDDYGRLYIPDALTCSVRVVDNQGNQVCRFGGYGNHDSQGPGSAFLEPAVPLAFPIAVQLSFKHIYVADCANRRVLRLDPKYELESTCTIE
jgi:DNA-binding beta-propeller fold protein YncE